ncbi:hypothetical protein [Laribacter hongkongensis]|jgi:hypothetical protein|uniref:hypothetical protein n=1 Tax=Laribacter hongkongensis TaxID=168471 RepID=UPI001EFEEDE2|nr:hypothetical protein [Laribacter hongkongensis]MCG8996459.1 hypothetical protein [Laribacter hongkongensis]MCG9046916.1 hypothetical protein [Laribacter hongkongensis]
MKRQKNGPIAPYHADFHEIYLSHRWLQKNNDSVVFFIQKYIVLLFYNKNMLKKSIQKE